MATYKLIPSSLTSDSPITDPSNAYTDTDSSTYAEVEFFGPAWLSGFDFSVIPSGETVSSIVVKCKVGNSIDAMILYGTSSGTALSESVFLSETVTVYTFTLTASVSTILQYSSTLGISFQPTSLGGYAEIYGAEIIITTSTPMPNKIIYGGNTLIDLTGDTALASDVLSGKTFHLASGIQATGALSPSVATATTSSSTARTVSFTVSKEPSWFMMICASTNTTARSYRVQHLLYDGMTTTMYYGNGSTAGSINTSTSHVTFSYSSGTLTISVDSSGPYLGAADWTLYYL